MNNSLRWTFLASDQVADSVKLRNRRSGESARRVGDLPGAAAQRLPADEGFPDVSGYRDQQ